MAQCILSVYENKIFNINSDIGTYQEDYKLIKEYLNDKIDFNTLMVNVNSCPLNACSWSDDNCDNCELKEIEDKDKRCRLCWEKCLSK